MSNGPTLRVTLVQYSPLWENPTGNRAEIEEQLEGLAGSTDVVVLPEMFTSGFTMSPSTWSETMEGPTHRWMKVMAARLDAALVASWMIRSEGRYYNRLFWITPDGQTAYYDKVHLFSLSGEDQFFSAGTRRLAVSFRGWRICPLICFDLRFGYISQQDPEDLMDAYVYIASWPTARTEAWQTLLKARAIENQAYVIGVNRVGEDGHGVAHSGHSGVYDGLGQAVFLAGEGEVVQTVSLDRDSVHSIRQRWPFWKDQKKDKNFV